MKKYLLALTALTLSTCAFGTMAGGGDIRSIESINDTAHGITFPNVTQPLVAGESLYVRIRLIDDDFMAVDGSHKWRFMPVTAGSLEVTDALNQPKLRLSVGGNIVEATYTDFGPTKTDLGGAMTPWPKHTDLYFKYTVSAGDLGGPVKILWGNNSVAGTTASALTLLHVNTYAGLTGQPWNLINESTGNLATMLYAPTSPYPQERPLPSAAKLSMNYLEEQVYVKTIDFEPQYANEDAMPDKIWREVYQHDTMPVDVLKPVQVEGAVTGAVVFVWSADPTVVRVVAGDDGELVPGSDVLKVKVAAGVGRFRLEGVQTNKTAKIYMSSQMDHAYTTVGESLEDATVVRTVQVVPPPKPYVTISDYAGATRKIELEAKADYETPAVFKVKLSARPTVDDHDVVINLNPQFARSGTLVELTELNPLVNRYVAILPDKDGDPDGDPTQLAASVTSVKLPTGQTEAVFYVYPFGRPTDKTVNQLWFKPTVAGADADFYAGSKNDAQCLVSDVAPAFENFSAPSTAVQGDTITVAFSVSDNWRDLQTALNTNGYDVVISLNGQKLYTTNAWNFAANLDAEFSIVVPENLMGADIEGLVTVKDKTHAAATEQPFKLTVTEKPIYTAKPIFQGPEGSYDPVSGMYTFCEGDQIPLSVNFSLPNTTGDRYAFIVPADTMSSNLVETTALTNGLPIVATGANPTNSLPALITFIDGDEISKTQTQHATKGRFNIVLGTQPTMDAPGFAFDTVYACGSVSFTVTNAAPTVVGVSKGAEYVEEDDDPSRVKGGVLTTSIPSGVPVFFTAKIDDLGLIDATNGTARVKWVWTDGDQEEGAEDPDAGKYSDFCYSNVSTNGITQAPITFSSAYQNQTVRLYVQDRDQKAVGASFGSKAAFQFKVKVVDMPKVYLSFAEGIADGNGNGIYHESTSYKDSSRPAFTVKVSEFPKRNSDFYTDPDSLKQDPKFDAKNPMVVRVTMGLPNDSSRIALVTNYVYFTSETQTKNGQKVYFDPVFQNGGPTEANTLPEPIAVTVEVMNGNIDEGFKPSRNKDKLPWCDYYATSDAALYMCNDAPKKFNLVSGTEGIALHLNGTNTWTTGQQIKINWTLGDIAYDLTNGVSYIELENITDLSGKTIIKITTNDTFTAGTTPLYGNTVAGSFAFKVPADSTEVKVRAFDGEGGMIEKVFFINIVPTKKVQINPFGPSAATDTKYDTAPGRGKGHIYVDDSTGSYVLRQFKQTWTYNESSQQAHVFAVGYLANSGNAYDKGTIDTGYTGAALGPTGNAPNGTADTDYYNYGNSPYDNFFYTWASNTAGEDGKLATKLTVLPPQPAKIKGYMADKLFMLDNGQNNQGNAQNNNQKKTGYATVEVEAIFAREHLAGDNMGDINRDFIPDVYTKYYKGLGVYSPEGEITGDDLAELTISNPDADYLPNTLTALYASVIPGLSNTWVTAGRAFTTKMEIRGAGDGFNDAPALANVPEVMPDRIYLDPDLVGEENSTLSHLEYVAFTNWCGRTAADTNECANLITNSANWVKWSPERPTDPTKADTDGDGLPDGYEYFFWYRAHVGYLDNDGNYFRQTGRKYNPIDPTAPIEITPEEIEAAYDPIVANPEIDQVDSDNDGIIDAIEFEIGTNPFDYDTDGDGLPDGYEAFISQTNPMVADRGSNGDGDQMALITLENVIPVTCVYKEDDNTVTNMLWSMESVRVAPNEEDDAITNLTSKVSLFTGYVYDIDKEGKPVWALGRLVLDAKDAKYDDKVKEYNVIQVGEGRPMRAIHFQVFAIKGFDPRVAWNTEAAVMVPIAHRVDTTGFTAYDEFMTMTFFLNVGAIDEADVTPKPNRTLINIWTACTTNPLNADTDGDGVPDGWELYVMGQGGFVCNNPMPPAGNGHDNHSPMINWTGDDDGLGNLNYVEEFCGIESCARYEDCETIVNVQPEWKNKYWPTNPFASDTDGDGVSDVSEKTFIYGDAPASTVYSGAIPGGGLNPNSWDTDLDGLPDGWELQFACSILVSSTTTTVETHSDTNGTSTVTNTVTTAGGPQADGMDGTVKDQMKDYDHDGLNNWQEYMVGAMRCWRYDDVTTPWTSTMLTDADLEAMSDEDFYQMLIDPWVDLDDPEATPLTYAKYNPFLGTGVVSPYVYFSCCNNAFDLAAGRLYMFKDGIYHDLTNDKRDGENRWSAKIMKFRPKGMGFMTHDTLGRPAAPRKYISCDPTNADTDGDGMDDYYELYHGINPLLGRADGKGDSGLVDVVARAYYDKDELPFPVNATDNFWFNASAVNTGTTSAEAQLKDEDQSMYDFVQFPWLNGLPEADPDGDNIRNAQESILPIAQAAATYQHIDPSPLWMTDTSYTNSLVSRFYYPTLAISSFNHSGSFMHTDADGNTTTYKFSEIPGFKFEEGLVTVTASRNPFKTFGTAFAYEENEGYDTDHDYLSDFEESQGKTKASSDPQMSDDPIRHQAMYFNGEDAFLQTQLPEEWILPNDKVNAEFRQNFLYFTVEAWVLPDASDFDAAGNYRKSGLFTVIERPIWTGASNAGDESFLRKNFLIGIKNGRWYAKFDSTGTDLNQPIEIKEGPEATAAWTHVAATFGPADEADTEGTGPMALKLYVDGILRKSLRSGVQPEHGVQAFNLTPKSKIVTVYEWEENPLARPMVSMIVGASAKTMRGIVFDQNWGSVDTPDMTTVADYGNFFKGHIDEVRVWDGARTAAAIKSDYENRTRYTSQLATKNRQAVYTQWLNEVTRMPSDSTKEVLPPELMYHWSFDHVPGAVDAKDVVTVPAGFGTSKGATDAKALWSRPADYVCGWWDSVDATIRSAVFSETAWVPWIGNTVAHLPLLDGETLDSVFWHREYYGFDKGSYKFPLTAEPASRMIQQHYLVESKDEPETQTTSYDRIAESEDEVERFRFTYRNRLTAGSDLLPLGGAFPKRLSSAEGLWDAPGAASDAWAETGVDADNNGLPEWWEEYALVEYADTTSVDWDTIVERNGQRMPAWQAYLRDLAAGMLPDGVIHPEYADTRDMDKDGLPDWWEDMYGVNTHSAADADADPDRDGLSNYQEYLIEKDGLYLLNPALSHSTTGQKENDYFLKTPTGEYLGEVYADHDFIEDNAEDGIGTDRHHYDAYSDKDEDGWTAFSEVRYAQFKQNISARFISHLVGEEEVKDCPVPVIHTLLRYNSESILETNAAIMVEAYAGNNLQKAPTAKWTIRPGALQERKLYLGRYIDGVVHGTLTPGHVIIGQDSVKLEMCFVQDRDQWSWTVDGEPFVGTYDEMWAAYSADVTHSHVKVNMDDYSWDNEIINGFEGVGWMQFSVDHETQKGDILFNHEKVGTIDVTTGDFAIDLSSLGKYFLNGNEVSAKQLFYRIRYTTKTPAMQNKALQISLANADVGTLVEGKTAFVAYVDKNGDGYTPDVDAIGFVKDVAVGWDQVPELVIEMSEKTQAGGKAFAYDPAAQLIRIVRTSVNGNDEIAHTTVYLRDHARATTTARNFVYDADYMDNGFGLDWSSLATDVDKMPGFAAKDITSVGYTVVKGKGSITNIDNANVVTNFTVTYTPGQMKPTAYAPTERQGGLVETARPTFTWTGGEGYTAFALRIFDASNKTVFDSGFQKLPAKDTNGRYAYQPGVWVADAASTNAFCNLANGSNYTWQVAMFNAKFRDMNEGWSDPAAFTVATAKTNDLTTNYGCAEVEVRYYGRAPGDQNDVIVQLFKNADFTGLPAAQMRLAPTEGDSVAALTNGASVVFTGLETGDYYAVAFLDRELPEQKKDGVRQKYETWGYAAQVDKGLAEIWKPMAVSVDPRKVEVPAITLYLEDTDINQNGILDFEEPYGAFPADGSGTSDTSVMDDTDGDGMPDKWETKYGLNPYDAEDAKSSIAGDVMAYADIDACLVRIGTDGGKAEWYAITDWEKEPLFLHDSEIDRTPPFPKLIDATNIVSAASVWENGSMYGLGTNVTFVAENGYKVLDSKWGKVRLVHAQVYALKGFNTKTAVPTSDAVDTKDFTALDKYLVGAYFNAIGLSDWKSRDLNPTQIDSDVNDGTGNALTNTGDGLTDGWEMYVMFGKDLASMVAGLTVAEAKISPYDRTDALKPAPGEGSELKLYEEFDNAYWPTDPWSVDTDGDGLGDKIAYAYHLKGEDALKDPDNDGLSNWAEYFATEKGYGTFNPDNACSITTNVLDYFVKTADGRYVGERVADHDKMADLWEDKVSVDVVNRYVYDPHKDYDGDGWSNYAEARVSTDPIRLATQTIEGAQMAQYPVPLISAKIAQSTATAATDAPIYIQAFASDPDIADATWQLNTTDKSSSTNGNQRILGSWSGSTYRTTLSPSSIQPGTVFLYAKDTGYTYYDDEFNETEADDQFLSALLGVEIDSRKWEPGDASKAQWLKVIHDVTSEDPTIGRLIFTPNSSYSADVGWINYENGQIEIDYAKVLGTVEHTERVTNLMVDRDQGGDDNNHWSSTVAVYDYYYHHTRNAMEKSYFRVNWTSHFVPQGANQVFYLSEATKGHLKEGLNTFVAFSDTDGNGAYTLGEPMGVVRDVNVGWDQIPELMIELSETARSGDRFTIGATSNATAYACVRIVRSSINGFPIEPRAVWGKVCNLSKGKTFTELDLIRDGEFAFDWANLAKDAEGLVEIDISEVRNVGYDVYIGWGEDAKVHSFTNTFHYTNVKPIPNDTYQNRDYLVLTAQPTLSWKADEGYSAFALQIATNADFADIVYATTNLMPAATIEGCLFKPDVYVGAELDDNTQYFWRVAQLNAKFTTNVWSDVATFKTAVDSTDRNTGYGKLAAEIRYYGPSMSTLDDVIVVVYPAADFCCAPVARQHLSGTATISTLTNTTAFAEVTANVTFDGLKSGNYYVMAFVDTNKNGMRDPYETWGYVCNVGEPTGDLWAPIALQVKPVSGLVPTGLVVMEDTDVNQNRIPDCLEDMTNWTDDPKRDELVDSDGDGLPDEMELQIGTNPEDPDTDRDGFDDGEEIDNGTNPLDPNDPLSLESAGPYDVMAYAEVTRRLVYAKSGEGIRKPYVVDEDDVVGLVTGTDLAGRTLYPAYEYAEGLWGVGQKMTASAGLKVVEVVENATVALIHAQVYEAFGFDNRTANPTIPENERVNTKPFTGADKIVYLPKYLKALGLEPRDLSPRLADSDGDGLPDGWELYVMFGNAGVTDSVDAATISPWNKADATTAAPGKDGLTVAENYDSGDTTDPWSMDTDNDGVTDDFAHAYHLQNGYADDDDDGDRLSNYAEYLITEVFKYAKCDPKQYATTKGVCDYFKKVGDLYLGEIFTDHDQMVDTVEDTMPGVKRDIYDADKDADGNGWSNYAEYRAMSDESQFVTIAVTNVIALADGTTSNDVTMALAYAGQPQPTITARLTYNGTAKVGDAVVVKAWKDATMASLPDATWTLGTSNLVTKSGNVRTYVLKAPTTGQVKEGLNTFACFFLEGGDATSGDASSVDYKAGAPWGFIRDVNIGWNAAEFDLELTDVSPVFARINVTDGSSDRLRLWGTDAGVFDTAQTMSSIVESNRLYDVQVGQETLSGGTMNHVRIVPYTISGTKQDTALEPKARRPVETLLILPNTVVAEFDIDTQAKPFITEADFVKDGSFDIYWDGFSGDQFADHPAVTMAVGDLTAVRYGIVLGTGALPLHCADTTTVARVFSTLVERRYEARDKRTKPTAMALLEGGILYGGNPTFTWRLDEPTDVVNGTPSSAQLGCSYTAFQIQVADTNNTIVYDSGLNRAPRQDAQGAFVWQAPLVAGQQTSLTNVFAKAGNWKWRVAMYNAKFKPVKRDTANGWSAWTPFSTAVGQQQAVGDHTYGSVKVTVKYAGPTAVVTNCMNVTTSTKGMVRVQAFATPDCSGAPCAETTLTDLVSLTNTLDVATNVSLDGLDVGGTYWVRAYIDSNGNCQKDVWESWGGTTEALTIVENTAAPTIGVWIEDCDTDGDWLPDAYEFVKNNGDLAKEGAEIDPDGEIVLKSETFNSVTNGVANISTHLSGASLTFFENLGAAALLLGIEGNTTMSTIQAIREAVQKKIVPNTVHVKALVVDAANKKVKLSVGGEVVDSIAGHLLSPIYTIPTTATVTISLYTKASLVDVNWIWVKDYKTTVSTTLDTTVEVDIDEDLTSGFYKVEVVQ